MTPAAFLARVVRLSAGDTPAALALVAVTVDRLLDLGLDSECDLILAAAEGVSLAAPAVRRVLLVVTRPAKHRLPARRRYFERTARALADQLGEAPAARALRRLA